ncbi:MAG: glycine cleavage system protein R [Kiritimatiellia bacterium]
METNPNRYVISVLIADRPGILRDITGTVTDLGANIDGIRQTVVAGYFTVMLTATLPSAITATELQQRMLKAFHAGDASIAVEPYDSQRVNSQIGGERYIVTLTGDDHSGILRAVTAFFAERKINIEDWNVEFSGSHITHVGQISVPDLLDIKQVQIEFRHLAQHLNLKAGIQHEFIFRAISEVGPIRGLLEQKHPGARS